MGKTSIFVLGPPRVTSTVFLRPFPGHGASNVSGRAPQVSFASGLMTFAQYFLSGASAQFASFAIWHENLYLCSGPHSSLEHFVFESFSCTRRISGDFCVRTRDLCGHVVCLGARAMPQSAASIDTSYQRYLLFCFSVIN